MSEESLSPALMRQISKASCLQLIDMLDDRLEETVPNAILIQLLHKIVEEGRIS